MAGLVPSDSTTDKHRLVERKSLHDQVVEALRSMIVLGELAPGTRIVENELAERLGVSRTPLREALKTLVLDGLIDSQIHRGARVKPLEPEETRALFDVIAVIEGLAAQCAARNMAAEELAALEDLHCRMRQCYDRGDRTAYFDINSAIHDQIVHLAANPVLTDTHLRLMLRARRGRYLAIVSRERWQEAMEEHEALMQAFRDNSPASAFAIWQTHLTNTGIAVLQSLSNGAAAARPST